MRGRAALVRGRALPAGFGAATIALDGDVAVPTLRDTPGGNGPLLGLQAILDDVCHVPELPALGRAGDRLLRP